MTEGKWGNGKFWLKTRVWKQGDWDDVYEQASGGKLWDDFGDVVHTCNMYHL